MDKNILKGNWKKVSGAVQNEWGKLTGDQLDQIEGNRDMLIGVIQEQYGLAKDEAKEQVRKFEEKLKP